MKLKTPLKAERTHTHFVVVVKKVSPRRFQAFLFQTKFNPKLISVEQDIK